MNLTAGPATVLCPRTVMHRAVRNSNAEEHGPPIIMHDFGAQGILLVELMGIAWLTSSRSVSSGQTRTVLLYPPIVQRHRYQYSLGNLYHLLIKVTLSHSRSARRYARVLAVVARQTSRTTPVLVHCCTVGWRPGLAGEFILPAEHAEVLLPSAGGPGPRSCAESAVAVPHMATLQGKQEKKKVVRRIGEVHARKPI